MKSTSLPISATTIRFFGGDASSLQAGMEENEKRFPNKTYQVHHTLSDQDLVMVHGHVRLQPDEPGFAAVHLFRIKNGRIAELWDVAQPIPKDSPNANGMF